MKYCEICTNKKECFSNYWRITMDRQRVLAQTGEYLCDNFITDKNVIILHNRGSDINGI